MDSRSLFESGAMTILGAKFAARGPGLAVFLSHSRLDKEKAGVIARALEALKVDYFFDENNEELQLADEQIHHLKVDRCIENATEACSHLITENAKGSWWVPYEIGSTSGRRRNCADLIDRAVYKLPSYLGAAQVLTNRGESRKWLPSEVTKMSTPIVEYHKRLATALDYPDFISADRSLDDLTWY